MRDHVTSIPCPFTMGNEERLLSSAAMPYALEWNGFLQSLAYLYLAQGINQLLSGNLPVTFECSVGNLHPRIFLRIPVAFSVLQGYTA